MSVLAPMLLLLPAEQSRIDGRWETVDSVSAVSSETPVHGSLWLVRCSVLCSYPPGRQWLFA